jgi:hypothetical protein
MAAHGVEVSERQLPGRPVRRHASTTLIEAMLRGTWVPAATITQATAGLTSVTAAGNVFTAGGGSWLTAGVRVGDVIRPNITGGPAGNNGRNLRVTGVTALALTVAETLTTDATARTTFSITIAKKVWQATSPVRRSFMFEEYHGDIDLSEQYTGCRVSSMAVRGAPDGMCTVEFGIVGADGTPLTTGTSPYFTAPTATTSIGLTMVDASLRFGGVDVLNLTGFDFTLDNRQGGQPVIGALVTPDVFDNNASLSGSISAIRQDLSALARLTGETELEFHALLVEPEAEPKDFISIFIPRLKLTGVDAPFGGDNAMIETTPWTAGSKEIVTGYDPTMIMIATSAP